MAGAPSRTGAVHVAFLGCGFITAVHSRHLAQLRGDFRCSYASRDLARAERYRQRYGGVAAFGDYGAALDDPSVDAVVVAVPPQFHLDLTVRALEARKHVLVEKPAFLVGQDYATVLDARDQVGRVVCVGENDHYKPLAVALRRLLAEDAIGDLVLAQFTTVAQRPKPAADWRNDPDLSGGDAFFEEGIHWLHLAGSLGPTIRRIEGFHPAPAPGELGGERRNPSMLVAFEYDNGGVGALYYSREIPSPLHGLRWSKLFGRRGTITFESNGGVIVAPGRPLPRVITPGLADLRGYRAMYRDFALSIRTGGRPEMDLERALADHVLMEQVRPRGD